MLPVEGVAAEEVAVVDEADEEVVVEEAVAGVVAEVVEDLVDAEADEAEAGEEAEVDIKHRTFNLQQNWILQYFQSTITECATAYAITHRNTPMHPYIFISIVIISKREGLFCIVYVLFV